MPRADSNVLNMTLVMVRANWQGAYYRYLSQKGGNDPPKRIEFPAKTPVALSPSELNDPGIQKALAKNILLPVTIDRQSGHIRFADPDSGDEQKIRLPGKPPAKRAPRKRKSLPKGKAGKKADEKKTPESKAKPEGNPPAGDESNPES